MARGKHYETSLLKRIHLAISRYEALGHSLAKGSPKSMRAELECVRGLQAVVRENLPAAERFFQSRQILQRIKEIEQRESQSRGLLQSIFQGSLSPSARAEIEELKKKIPQGSKSSVFSNGVSGDVLRAYEKSLAEYERLLERSLPYAEERKQIQIQTAEKRAIEKEAALSRKTEKKAQTVALAAAHVGKTRRLAQTVKRNIEHQLKLLPICPYCSSALGDDPHADHIYPVARGGLSTMENMVFVCAPCNSKKSDKTLREFIKAMGFDHSAIEQRLELLEKRF